MLTIFVGNLAPETTENDVRELFAEFGKVRNLKVSFDVFTGNCRGRGLVDMEGHEARAAIAALNGRTYKGNQLRVALERKDFKGGRGGRRR